MPTYQYACTQCDERLEAVQSFSDPALTVCPACEGRLRKVFSAVGVVFKGSGFYKTDSRGGSGGEKGAGDGAAAKDGGGKDGAKDGAAGGGSKDGASGGAKESASGGTKESASSTPAAASSRSSSTPAAKSA